jgi:hypothetical protein
VALAGVFIQRNSKGEITAIRFKANGEKAHIEYRIVLDSLPISLPEFQAFHKRCTLGDFILEGEYWRLQPKQYDFDRKRNRARAEA